MKSQTQLRVLKPETRQQILIESLQREIADLKRDRFEVGEIVVAFKNGAALCRARGKMDPDSIRESMLDGLRELRHELGPMPNDCPHCGSPDAEVIEFEDGFWRGKCRDCGSLGQIARSFDIALFHWNRRA